jgi:Holliday junction resolvase RusA-like endonuclease
MIARLDLPTIRKNKSDRMLTMNIYRNAHWAALAKSKRDYAEHITGFIESLPVYKGRISIHYTLFFSNKRKKDVDNLTYPVHKFMCDEMTKAGKIADDNVEILVGFSAFFGGYGEEDYVMVEIVEEE